MGLVLLAFLLRLGAVLGLRDIHEFHSPSPAGADAVEFNAIALNLVSGNGYTIVPGHPTAFRATRSHFQPPQLSKPYGLAHSAAVAHDGPAERRRAGELRSHAAAHDRRRENAGRPGGVLL